MLPECLRLCQIPAARCSLVIRGVSSAIQNNLHSPKEWASWLASDPKLKTYEPCRQTLLLTGAPGCPTESNTGSCQCYSLQCSLVHGSGRLLTVKVPLSQPCFDHFFGPCFRGHDEAGLLAFEALQGLPRPARGTRTKRGSRGLESI